jgi:membrane protein YdbS with pleckstrin-like domain
MDSESQRHAHEVTRWSGQPAWSEYVFLWFFTLVVGVRASFSVWLGQWGTAAIYGAGIAVFVGIAVFFRRTTRYTLTQEAIYRTTGLFGRSEDRLPLAEVESVSVRQRPLDRLFGIGTVEVRCANGKDERLSGLKDPEVICRKIEALLRPAKPS